MTMIIGSFLILFSYTCWAIFKNKQIPESISQSYYLLEHKSIFTLIIWSFVFMSIGTIKEIHWTLILAMIGILGVGAAPRVNDKFERIFHTSCAIVGCCFSQLWIILTGNPLILLDGLLIPFSGKYKIFITEVLCIINYYLNLILWNT